jgi:hypothetical protein
LYTLISITQYDDSIRRETKVRIFCVIADMIATGASKNKKNTPNNSYERYEATQKLDTICKDFADSDYHFSINEYQL